MFGISFPELLMVLLAALIIFGPKRLPEIAKTLGQISGKLKKESDKLRRDFYNSVYEPAEDFNARLNSKIKKELVDLDDMNSEDNTEQLNNLK